MNKSVKNEKLSSAAPLQGVKKRVVRPRPYMTGRVGSRSVSTQSARWARKAPPLGNLKFIPLGGLGEIGKNM